MPEEIDIPKLIYDLYTQSDSLTAVEAELLRRRIKTKLGKNFSRFAIKAILQNPVYMVADEDAYDFFLGRKAEVCFPKSEFDGSCGIMAYNRTDQEKGRAMILLPMEEWIIALGKHPGIVPSKQWITVQQSLERNKSKGYRKPRNNEALLTGLIYCSCGERMYPKLTERRTGSGELIYTYVCKMKERSKRTRCNKRNANGNILDAAIIEQLKTLTEKDSAFMKQMEKSRQFYTGNREQYDTQLTKLREELAQNEKIVAGLLDSLGLVGDSIARPSMLRRIEELTEANRVIDCQIRELEGLVTANHLSDGEFDLLRQILAMFRENVDQMSVEEKRAAVRTVVRKVIWDGENAHVILFGAEDGDLDYPNIDERLSKAGEDDENNVEDLVDIECEESDINGAFIEENGTFTASKSRWGDGSK